MVPVRVNADNYFPIPEGLFQQASIQPFIHSCQVTILEGSSRFEFAIFFKNHCRLAPNLSLARNLECVRNPRQEGPFFRGDLVILKMGVRKPFVNIRGHETRIADYAAKRCVVIAEGKNCLTAPSVLSTSSILALRCQQRFSSENLCKGIGSAWVSDTAFTTRLDLFTVI
jgi:hypothetical protein